MKQTAHTCLFAATVLALTAHAAQAQTAKRGGQLKFAVSAEPPN